MTRVGIGRIESRTIEQKDLKRSIGSIDLKVTVCQFFSNGYAIALYGVDQSSISNINHRKSRLNGYL